MKYLLPIILCLILASCNTAAKQRAEQAEKKAFADSIANAQHQIDIQIQQQEANLAQQKADLQGQIKALTNKLNEIQQANIQLQSQLTAANDELNRAEEWQFMRSSSERERDIKYASTKVNTIKTQLFNLKTDYDNTTTALNDTKAKLTAMN